MRLLLLWRFGGVFLASDRVLYKFIPIRPSLRGHITGDGIMLLFVRTIIGVGLGIIVDHRDDGIYRDTILVNER